MTADGSYTAWARPTRRVHLALSLGMTVTGVILVAAGVCGSQSPVRQMPPLGPTADTVVSGGSVGSGTLGDQLPPAPLVRFAPTLVAVLNAVPGPTSHGKPAPVKARVPAPEPPHHGPLPSDVSRPSARRVDPPPPPAPAPQPAHPPKR